MFKLKFSVFLVLFVSFGDIRVDSIAFSLFEDILVELDKSEANPNNNLMIFIRALSSMSS